MDKGETTKVSKAKARYWYDQMTQPITQEWLRDKSNSKLYFALENASQAEQFIEPEQARLRELLAEAKSEVERNAREYQIWYVEMYLKRAARIAKERLEYFSTIKTDAQKEKEKEKCKADKIHWFKYYAWGYDPRARTALSTVPFELFPKQANLIGWLDDIVFHKRTSGLIEKSRDEGATELMVRWGVHNWQYRRGFSMLLSTRTEDEVDTKKKRGTLFERMRFQIRLLPDWMLPEGFDIDKDLLPDKLIANPENGNQLFGQAPVENMGRGDRVTCAMFDEFAFWRFGGYPQFRSMSQTTDSILMPSSVAGKLNQYADLAFDGGITPKFTLDWRENPFKDKRWYDALPFGYISPKMSSTTVAQEVDRNYDAAQPGKVWKFDEKYIFITQSEFLRPFREAGMEYKFFDDAGNFRIPADWRVFESSDYGQTEGHEWSYGLFAQPRANYPLSDTHFCFVNINLEPTGLTTQQAVAEWRKSQVAYGIREGDATMEWINKPFASYISHEQDGKRKAAGEKSGLRTVLLHKYGEIWRAWKPDYHTSIEKVQDWWIPIEKTKPNPFRPNLMGRCQLIFVAPDGEYQLAYNERLEQHFVTVSQSEAGFFTARKQIGAYHYPETELGKAVKAMRPVKEFDDIIDNIRGYAVMWNRTPIQMTEEELIEREIPEKVKTAFREKEQRSKNPISTRLDYEFHRAEAERTLWPERDDLLENWD